MPVLSYTKTGAKSEATIKLDKSIFDVVPKNHELLKANYVAYLANARLNLASTKTRGMISGGGKKPHPQKGTGRARSGSSRNPIWRGGGTVFGPTGIENYSHKVNKKAKHVAIKQVLSLASKEGKLIVIEDVAFSNKTSDAVKLFKKIGVSKNILLVVADKTPGIVNSVSNLPNVILVQAKYLNVYDGMNADHIILTQDSLKIITEWLGGESK